MSKIVSFGDSFIFGSELKNNPDGSKSWPGLISSPMDHPLEEAHIAAANLYVNRIEKYTR